MAGYDLTFSPVKSVSAFWAVAPPEVARLIEQAHEAALADALAYIERAALFTREGTDGARKVETRGLIATAFRHRDSRAGDPDLHTHVAVANKVQTREGKWPIREIVGVDGALCAWWSQVRTTQAGQSSGSRARHPTVGRARPHRG